MPRGSSGDKTANKVNADECLPGNLKAPTKSQMLRRALIHVIVGLSCAGAVLILPYFVAIILIALVTAGFLAVELVRLHSTRVKGLISTVFSPFMRESETRAISGASYLLLGCFITSLIFTKYIAVSAMLFVIFGDPVAAMFCTLKGRIRLWGKYLEGNIACLVTCAVLGLILAQINGFPKMAVLITGAVVAALFQALPSWLNDNLTIPVGSALAMWIVNLITH
jgi:dolichol kinase